MAWRFSYSLVFFWMDDWRGPRDHQYERARVLPVLVVGFSQFSMQVDRSHAEVNVDDRAGDPGGGGGGQNHRGIVTFDCLVRGPYFFVWVASIFFFFFLSPSPMPCNPCPPLSVGCCSLCVGFASLLISLCSYVCHSIYGSHGSDTEANVYHIDRKTPSIT